MRMEGLILVVLAFAAAVPPPVSAAPRSSLAGRRPARYALIIAAVGDNSLHGDWFRGARSQNRNWDLVALYTGSNENFVCRECRAVWKGSGSKWTMLRSFVTEQQGYKRFAHRYAAVMVADDDLRMSGKDFNRFFDIFVAANLTIAQPSLCPNSFSYWWNVVGRREDRLLHFTNFVELMAPTFSGKFFDRVVRGSLERSPGGWGLDFVWPWRAGWPKDGVAVVDAVCMAHQGRAKADLTRTGREKDVNATFAAFNFTQAVVEAAGMEWRLPLVFKELPANYTLPKVSWRKRLEKSSSESSAWDGESHSGLAVFIVMLAAAGVLLLQGNHTRRVRPGMRLRRPSSRTRYC